MPLSFRQMIDIPPMWLAGAVIIAWMQAHFFPMTGGHIPGAAAVGTGLVLAGCGLIFGAAWVFWRHRTTIIPHLEPAALVTSGVFSYSRNPIYLADALILTGLCLRWGAYGSLLLVPLFIALIQRRFILAEEDRLRRAFGAAFDEYARKVRRWA